jgi:hypothetical protein
VVLSFFFYLCAELLKMRSMKNIEKIVLGVFGTGSVELVNNIDIPTSTETKDIVSIVIQLVIGVVTLFVLFKKKRPSNQ